MGTFETARSARHASRNNGLTREFASHLLVPSQYLDGDARAAYVAPAGAQRGVTLSSRTDIWGADHHPLSMALEPR